MSAKTVCVHLKSSARRAAEAIRARITSFSTCSWRIIARVGSVRPNSSYCSCACRGGDLNFCGLSVFSTTCLDLLRLIRRMVRDLFVPRLLLIACSHPLRQAPSFMPRTSVQCVLLACLCSLVDFGFITFFCVQDRSRRCCNVLRSVQALVPLTVALCEWSSRADSWRSNSTCVSCERSVSLHFAVHFHIFLKLNFPVCRRMDLASSTRNGGRRLVGKASS